MEKYTRALEILLKHVSVKELLAYPNMYREFGKSTFEVLANSHIQNYSNNEVQNLFYYFCEEYALYKSRLFGEDHYKREIVCQENLFRMRERGIRVFDTMLVFANYVLLQNNGEPVCNYRHLLRWRTTAHILEEDLFVCSYLAYKDLYKPQYKRDFRWKLVIGTNNKSLHQILDRGVAENHFHLNGSAPLFHLSWLSLMNHIASAGFAEKLKQYEKRRLFHAHEYNADYADETLMHMHRQAALIRFLLFMKLSGRRITVGSCMIQAAALETYLDYRALDIYFWTKNLLLETMKGYKRMSLMELLAKADNKIWEKIQADDKAAAVLKLLQVVWLDKDELMRTQEVWVKLEDKEKDGLRITLAQLVRVLLTGNWKFPLVKLEGLVDKETYLKLEEKVTLQNVTEMLKYPETMEENLLDIQRMINTLRQELSRRAGYRQMTDYALPYEYGRELGKIDCDPKNILTGERKILYRMFQHYFNGTKSFEPYMQLFYMYLVIKEKIRSELIQVNDNVGFQNFQMYQSRKMDFIWGTVFEKFFLRLAVVDTMRSINMVSLETRIVPNVLTSENMNNIRKYDDMIGLTEDEKKKMFYVFHFVKTEQQEKELESELYCRHEFLRRRIKRQAFAIKNLRDLNPTIGRRVLGIDACSEEIGCRPEVFGPAFRFLRNYVPKLSGYSVLDVIGKIPELGITYHVGEDFLDLVDGLRAIEEACMFLGLKCGDRLGHALALGVDSEEWYESKNRRVFLSKQDYLDDLVWVFTKIRQLNLDNYGDVLLFIENEFARVFQEVYLDHISQGYIEDAMSEWEDYRKKFRGQETRQTGRIENRNSRERKVWRKVNSFDIYTYYDAWTLRGDEPECYRNGFYQPYGFANGGWEMTQVNREETEHYAARYQFASSFLYHCYHYHPEVKKEGAKIKEVKVSGKMIRIVHEIQKALQKDIAAMGLGIEANPSSNYLIGTFKRYDKHPMLKFYNIGLTYDEQQLKSCPQIMTSINTDDQGVFATSLENEYALMVLALERIEDKNGGKIYPRETIYKWLDNVREIGIRQSFLGRLDGV